MLRGIYQRRKFASACIGASSRWKKNLSRVVVSGLLAVDVATRQCIATGAREKKVDTWNFDVVYSPYNYPFFLLPRLVWCRRFSRSRFTFYLCNDDYDAASTKVWDQR